MNELNDIGKTPLEKFLVCQAKKTNLTYQISAFPNASAVAAVKQGLQLEQHRLKVNSNGVRIDSQ